MIKKVLAGEGLEIFSYSYSDFDIKDWPYLTLNENNLLLLKIILRFEKEENDFDYDIHEIDSFRDILDIISENDIDDLESLLSGILCRSNELADGDCAYEHITNEIYDFFKFEMGSAKWQDYKGTEMFFIKFKSESDAFSAKFKIMNYDNSYEDDRVIEYSPPYNGYSADSKSVSEYFNNELSENDLESLNSEAIFDYYNYWQKIKKANPDFSDEQIEKECQILLDSNKFGL